MKKGKDTFGDRMKFYENQTCGIKLLPQLPIVARLDGKGFSKFTKGLERPYDKRLSDLMIKTTEYLVKETNANCGYTQSDEISLVWYVDSYESQTYFNGRYFKIIGDLAGMASVFFNRELPKYLPEKVDKMPRLDARAWNVPSLIEATNVFLWREQDATKNSITMAASEYYSHNQLEYKNGKDKQEMLFQKGVNWNDYPDFFKRGTYVQRKRVVRPYTVEELDKLPKLHKARQNPSLEIERWQTGPIDLPPLSNIDNRVDVIIFGKDPILK